MKQDDSYWIWLQQGLGCGSAAAVRIAELYEDPCAFYQGGEKEWRLSGRLSPKQLDRLANTPLDSARQIQSRCAALGYRVVPWGSPEYPPLLRQIARPPIVFYMQGDPSVLQLDPCIAIVGTRAATPYGIQMARYFAGGLARAGAVVVSGGAVGIDTASHLGALEAGGKTIAVLGCGINTPYLPKSQRMRTQIAGQGALLSEFPPDTPALPHHFPMRNRIIAGLSRGVLVVEAGLKSGSLITAQRALDEGRDVFAVPGNLNSPESGGTNALIRTAAKPVGAVADVMEEYCATFTDTLTVAPPAPQSNQAPPFPAPVAPEAVRDALSREAKQLYDAMSREPVQIDELAARAGLTAREALMAVTELELQGAATGGPGKRFALL